MRAHRQLVLAAAATAAVAWCAVADRLAADESTAPEVPVVELVPPEGPALGLATVLALACDDSIRAVGFWVDGDFIAADDSPPFELTTDFGATFAPHTVRALAVDRNQVSVGEASIELNTGEAGLVAEIEHADRSVHLRANAPPGSPPPVSFQIYADGHPLATHRRPRLDLAMPRNELNDVDVLRLAAEYDDGSRLDRFLVLNEGFNETVDVNEVQLRVLVTDRRGRPVFDLDPDAFRVTGPGVEPGETPVEVQPAASLTLAVILDGSSSMDAQRRSILESTETLASELLAPGDRLLLFDVADRPRLLNPSGDPSEAVATLDQVVSGGGTALYDSLYFALSNLSEYDGRRALILVSDGGDLDSYVGAERVADTAWRAGVPVFLVGSGSPLYGIEQLSAYKLRRFIDSTGGRAFYAGGSQGQISAFETILELVRNPYVLSVTAGGSDLTQLREISIELPDPKLEAKVSLAGEG